jgi:hypothetical protein
MRSTRFFMDHLASKNHPYLFGVTPLVRVTADAARQWSGFSRMGKQNQDEIPHRMLLLLYQSVAFVNHGGLTSGIVRQSRGMPPVMNCTVTQLVQGGRVPPLFVAVSIL